MTIDHEKIKEFQQIIQDSQNIVFFGGAGVSTESGIPDFRSADGIFMQETGTSYSPEQIISYSFFRRYPEIYFDFHFDKLVYPQAQPNIAHHFPAQLEAAGKNVTVVTQNIDGLHQKSGSSKVLELHGTVNENYCVNCGTFYNLEDIVKDEQGIPRCPKDQGIVRPNIVMYEEALDAQVIEGAIQAIQGAELLVVMGTSLMVYPAASFIQYFRGKHLVVINKTPLQLHRPDILSFESTISQVFNEIDLDQIFEK